MLNSLLSEINGRVAAAPDSGFFNRKGVQMSDATLHLIDHSSMSGLSDKNKENNYEIKLKGDQIWANISFDNLEFRYAKYPYLGNECL